MINEEKHKETAQAYDNLDEQIYRAMVERGWVFPQTIEEVEIIEEQMDCETAPSRTGLPTAEAILKKIASANSPPSETRQEQQKQPPLLLLRQRTQMKASAIAERLEITVTFLSDLSSHSNVIPFRPRATFAELAEERLPGVKRREVLGSFEYNLSQPVAAFRDSPFREEKIDYEKIVRRSDMSEEQQRYWLSLAEEESR
jgi:hypothetical protein